MVDVRVARAPGRVNLMGDHTDYNDGFALPMAIELGCRVRFEPMPGDRIVIASDDVVDPAEVSMPAGGELWEPPDAARRWASLVAAVARVLHRRGRPTVGMRARISSTVPLGAGLSSSAALEVSTALAMLDVAEWQLSTGELVSACREAEQEATGVPCGPLDQVAALHGERGHALLLDCRSLEVQPVSLPDGLEITAIHSGIARELGDSGYAARREACEELARDLGVASLREASPGDVRHSPLGRHVVSENARVPLTADALRNGDRPALRELFEASHRSLAEDYAVSTPAIDRLVDEVMIAGAVACRMTGGGFGGCVVALTDAASTATVIDAATGRYGDATGNEPMVFPCVASGGASIDPP